MVLWKGFVEYLKGKKMDKGVRIQRCSGGWEEKVSFIWRKSSMSGFHGLSMQGEREEGGTILFSLKQSWINTHCKPNREGNKKVTWWKTDDHARSGAKWPSDRCAKSHARRLHAKGKQRREATLQERKLEKACRSF